MERNVELKLLHDIAKLIQDAGTKVDVLNNCANDSIKGDKELVRAASMCELPLISICSEMDKWLRKVIGEENGQSNNRTDDNAE